MWLPPGGHIDRDELPHHCAVREVREETGLEVTIVEPPGQTDNGIRTDGVEVLPLPRYILLEDINPNHQHIDFIYFARAVSDVLSPMEGESTDMRWLDPDELTSDPKLTPDIRTLGREAIAALGGNGEPFSATLVR